ncbi:MAG: hypothetical protein LKJ86_08160 [Oscillibacter sp.]|jgi:bacteriorhodopsin|nr:hypothetical protein [Oscillibacter sp.]
MLLGIFLDLLFCVVYNAVLVICGVVSYIKARRGKRPFGWLIAGSAFQFFVTAGAVTGMLRNAEQWMSRTSVMQIVSTVVIFLVFLYFINDEWKYQNSK